MVIVEGVAAAVAGTGRLQRFLAAYNPKYDWDAVVTDDEVTDSAGAAGPAYRVRLQGRLRLGRRHASADPLVLRRPTTSVTP